MNKTYLDSDEFYEKINKMPRGAGNHRKPFREDKSQAKDLKETLDMWGREFRPRGDIK